MVRSHSPHRLRRSTHRHVVIALLLAVPAVLAGIIGGCSGGDDKADSPMRMLDSGRRDAMGRDVGDDEEDEAGASEDGGSGEDSAVVDRGRYLVDHVAACGSCHTPGGDNPDPRRYLGGVDCLIHDVNNPNACLGSSNLTNHSTGLARRSDSDIKRMFLNGRRPEGRSLNPVMPYWVYHNMTDADADAIVAYLRTVPAVNHIVQVQAMAFAVREPAAAISPSSIPKATTEAGERGRYLASMVGRCLECHTPAAPRGSIRPIDMAEAFGGNRAFTAKELGLPPGSPDVVYSANISPAPVSGIGFWSIADIQKALREGRDNNDGQMCAPMPMGPIGGYGGLTDEDSHDIATYLKELPPIDKFTTANCVVQ